MDVLAGHSPTAPVAVPMNGAIYLADIMGGQKTGLFFDQRPNHAFAAGLSQGARVLDVFAHVGGFGLAALAQGAASVLAVDGSAPALDLAEQGAAAMGVAERFSTRKGDAFDVLTALAEEGAQFDVVICDPPAFAPGKAALEAGLRAYERVARLAAPLVAPRWLSGAVFVFACGGSDQIPQCIGARDRAGRAALADHPYRFRRTRPPADAASGRKRLS